MDCVIDLLSIQCHLRAIRCSCLQMSRDSKTAAPRVKRIDFVTLGNCRAYGIRRSHSLSAEDHLGVIHCDSLKMAL